MYSLSSRLFSMATASLLNLNPQADLQFSVAGIDSGAAKRATELLQENHENHHIMFNSSGLHSRYL